MKKAKFKNFIFILIIPFLCFGFIFSGSNYTKTVSADEPEYSKAALIWTQLQSDVNSVFNTVSGGEGKSGLFEKLDDKRRHIPGATNLVNPNLFVWEKNGLSGNINTGNATQEHLDAASTLLGTTPSRSNWIGYQLITIKEIQTKYTSYGRTVSAAVPIIDNIFGEIKKNPTGNDPFSSDPQYGSIGEEERAFNALNGTTDNFSGMIYSVCLYMQELETQITGAVNEGSLKKTAVALEINDMYTRVIKNKTADPSNYELKDVDIIFNTTEFKYPRASFEQKEIINNKISSLTSFLNLYTAVKSSYLSADNATTDSGGNVLEYSDYDKYTLVKTQIDKAVSRWNSLKDYYASVEIFDAGLAALPSVLEVTKERKNDILAYKKSIEDFIDANPGLYVTGAGLTPELKALNSYLWNANIRLAQIKDNEGNDRGGDLFIIVLSFGGVFVVIFSVYWFVNYKKRKVNINDLPDIKIKETKINEQEEQETLPKKFFGKK